jgi:glycosyltransferase involved in cell wall biosynthesis
MIGINASVVGENPTGLGIYSIKVIQELDQLRRDFCVHTSAPEFFPGLRASIRAAPAAVRPGLGARGHLARLLWLQSVLRLRATMSRLRLLLNTVPEGILGSSIPQITVVHDLLPLAFPREYPRQQYYFRHLVPRVLRASRMVVTDSEYTRRSVIDRYGLLPGKVRVVYPGYNPDVYHPNGLTPRPLSGDDQYLLYVGMLGLEPVVSFLGYTTEKVMRDLYVGAACVVLPSLGEGFGLPVLEAIACGTPVVAADVSSLPEVAGDAALMVNPHNSLEVAEAMFRILSDADLAGDLRERGLRRAGEFTWRRTGEGISRLLDETLA